MFTSLNIINRTPKGCPAQCLRATLPIYQLYHAPSTRARADSNVHRCNGVNTRFLGALARPLGSLAHSWYRILYHESHGSRIRTQCRSRRPGRPPHGRSCGGWTQCCFGFPSVFHRSCRRWGRRALLLSRGLRRGVGGPLP
jgi:hypothetical protein